ncbi:hypothetical protein COT42_04415 [Candidatus Saganbacteria bacterium CG08_land_8_20_14_0_20_45_16]|uniref:Uncharacterized protein n=1 Tax=Candidatus Saganbacteria bacterium CG08_land_8_20_14_0_20_45_16 TaxID=2014293 RepID=A0A2H0Y017_UNCSA|nr:MAG: hypothetical protein COT42_04415 [Candidatus Saganbacteria bacterium CG08_land_8_20_14_0_20_45_16]
MSLPKYFRSILWFSDFDKLSLETDRETILFQALEKGRMEHVNYLIQKLGRKALYDFAKKNAGRFSRKSILSFAKVIFA